MVKSGRPSGLRKRLLHIIDRYLFAPVKDMSLGKLNHLRIIESLAYSCEGTVSDGLSISLIVNQSFTGIRSIPAILPEAVTSQ